MPKTTVRFAAAAAAQSYYQYSNLGLTLAGETAAAAAGKSVW